MDAKDAQKHEFPCPVTCNTRAPHFTPQHWLLCHKGLY